MPASTGEVADAVGAHGVADQPSQLSIVVQGSIYDHNIVQTANHLVHWRRLFPSAQIVLAIATTDMLAGSNGRRQVLQELELVPNYQHDGLLWAAVSRLRAACDVIVLSEGALPLPALKSDGKINNANLMITAAQAGLAAATGRYVLRIRSDMIFLSRAFLRFYDENAFLPRRSAGAFRQRVMISPFYTLNPFTMERLPFHYSDWFHFGLTEDVGAIWRVGEMPLSDALHHAVHPHEARANRLERKFRVRIAVEQHVALHALGRHYQDLRLDHLTDSHSAERSVEILLNDFLICDPRQVPIVFDKYAKTLGDPNMEALCITYPQWRALLDLPAEVPFAAFFARAARKASIEILIREDPALRGVKLARGVYRYLRRQVWHLVRFSAVVARRLSRSGPH